MHSQRVLTILRGEALRSVQSSGSARSYDLASSGPRAPGLAAAPIGHDGSTIDGVPLAAAQHCCGRGCKHCRIYWLHIKP